MNSKLEKAKQGLLLDAPFYSLFMCTMRFKEDSSIPWMATDGRSIYYNNEEVNKLPLAEIQGIIVHELDHIIHLHHLRQGERKHKKWNYACDYAINPNIRRSGYILPKDTLDGSEFGDNDAETIYNMIPDPPEQGQGGQGDGTDYGQVLPAPVQTEEERKQLEREIRGKTLEAAMIARKAGKVPAHMKRLIDEILNPKVDWRTILRSYLSDYLKTDYSWTQPNKRYLSRKIYLPSMKNLDNLREITFIHDTSSSRGQKEMNEVYAEVMEILNVFRIDQLRMLYVDAEVQDEQIFASYEPLNFEPKGGGGTSFKPGFQYLLDNNLSPNVVVYFTDGRCNDFPDREYFPTIWILHGGKKNFKPSFGRVIDL